MEFFIQSQNIINFADKLATADDPTRRATLMKLLVDEEDRLGLGTQELDLVNTRLTNGVRLIAKQQSLIVRLALDGRDTSRANLLLTQLMEVQALFEKYRQKIVDGLNGRLL